MANKTQSSDMAFATFAERVEPALRRDEVLRLDALFRGVTGFEPAIWGGSMVGYGRYTYRNASGREAEWFATGFAPRKAALVIYILPGYADFSGLLADLGPHSIGKSCLYLKRLDGVDQSALARLIRAGLDDLATHWPITA